MAEDEDLEVLGAVFSATLASADDEGNEDTDEQVDERPHRSIVPGSSVRESGFLTPTGSCSGRHLPAYVAETGQVATA
jgi:hypothetical protein